MESSLLNNRPFSFIADTKRSGQIIGLIIFQKKSTPLSKPKAALWHVSRLYNGKISDMIMPTVSVNRFLRPEYSIVEFLPADTLKGLPHP